MSNEATKDMDLTALQHLPWFVDRSEDDDGFGVYDARGAMVASTPSMRLATFIAVSPDILSLMKELSRMATTSGRMVGWNSETLDAMNAIIAKAEGSHAH